MLDSKELKKARLFIKDYWPKLIVTQKKNDDTLIGLPNPYLVPSRSEKHQFDFDEMYYWDSYFMIQGMLDKEHKKLVEGILDNLIYLQKKYGVIPNASRTYLMGRSQPPLLTSFIFDVYDAYKKDKKWLKPRIEVAKKEYEKVWMGEKKPNWRQVHRGLSRYYDINMVHDLAEAESGWDMTTRFRRKALDYLPIDLNCMLYKYEVDFARAAEILGYHDEAAMWIKKAAKRRETVDKLMWGKKRKLYFDYNFSKERLGDVGSLAAYFALWSGLADDKKAKQMVKTLKKFTQKGGLVTTDGSVVNVKKNVKKLISTMPTQWAYPNGWAPLHFIVVEGLKKYGYDDEAELIAKKWMHTNLVWFKNNKEFLEKYNVVDPSKPPAKGIYPSQTGFGWTNAIFERFAQDFID